MTTTDPFTEAASAAAEKQWPRELISGHPLSGPERMNRRIGFTMGAEWARAHLAAQEPTDAAQIIDQHRVEKRWVGDGVRIECRCRHESSAVWDPAAGPLTEEGNTHRVADRLHAAHVADMLARRNEEKRAGK